MLPIPCFAVALLAAPAVAETVPLEAALTTIEAENPSLTGARANRAIAEMAPARARSQLLPSVTAIGIYTRNNTAAELAFPDFTAGFQTVDGPEGPILVPVQIDVIEVQRQDQLTARLRVEQGVIVPAAFPAIGAARAGMQAAYWGTEEASRQVLFGATEVYLGCVALQEGVRVTEDFVDLLQDHLTAVEAGYAAGSVAEIAVLRARLDLRNAEQDLVRAERDEATALGQLATLMGREDSAFDVEAPARLAALLQGEEPGPVMAIAEDDVLPRRASFRSSEANLRAAKKQRSTVAATFLPSVGAAFDYQYSNVAGFAGRNDVWSASASLSIPVFDRGSRVQDLREADLRIREAEAALKEAALEARQDLREATLSADAARIGLTTARETATLARRSWEAVNVSFQAGAATPLEVADAASNLRGAELTVVTEAVNVVSAEIRLARARGADHPLRYANGEATP